MVSMVQPWSPGPMPLVSEKSNALAVKSSSLRLPGAQRIGYKDGNEKWNCNSNNGNSNHNMVIVIVCKTVVITIIIIMIIIIIIVVVIWTYEHRISYSCLFTKSDPAIIMAYFGVRCFSFQGPWCRRQPNRALWPVHPARSRPVATWQRMWGFGTGA